MLFPRSPRPPDISTQNSGEKLLYEGRTWYPFAHGRHALGAALSAVSLPAGSRILVPETQCDVVIPPLVNKGYILQYYPLHDDLTPIWSTLGSMMDGASAIMAVHYFGQAQDMCRFCDFAQQHSLLLIEDGAHAWGSRYKGNALGTIGDIGVVSPWKVLGLPEGALLHIKEEHVLPQLPGRLCNYGSQSFIEKLKVSLKARFPFLQSVKHYFLPPKVHPQSSVAMPPYTDQWALRSPYTPEYALHNCFLHYIEQTDLDKCRAKRRDIYAIWQSWTAKYAIMPVFSVLHAETSPLCFAGYVNSPVIAEEWFRWGWHNGIDIYSWPTLPLEMIQEENAAMHRWRRMLCFPIHQQMDEVLLRNLLARLETTLPITLKGIMDEIA